MRHVTGPIFKYLTEHYVQLALTIGVQTGFAALANRFGYNNRSRKFFTLIRSGKLQIRTGVFVVLAASFQPDYPYFAIGQRSYVKKGPAPRFFR